MSLRFQYCLALAVSLRFLCPSVVYAEIVNWQTGETIPGTEGITPRPGIQLTRWNTAEHNLRYADCSGGLDLSNSNSLGQGPTEVAAVVPEPSSAVLGMIGWLIFTCMRHDRSVRSLDDHFVSSYEVRLCVGR